MREGSSPKIIEVVNAVLEVPEPEPRWGKPAYVMKHYGLPRYRVFELIKDRVVRSALIRRKGRKKGLRLIDLNSLDEFLARHASAAQPTSD
jgi:hypothetical protein